MDDFHFNRIMENIQIIFSGAFFFQIVVCAIFIATILSSLDQNLQNMSYEFVININCLVLEILLNYISCSYAQSVTSNAFEVADVIYDTLWYQLPMKQQKMICMTIRLAQKPVYLQGYKIFTCSMETFLTVSKQFELKFIEMTF